MQDQPSFWKRLRGDLLFVGSRIIVYEAIIVAGTLALCAWRGWTSANEIALALLAVGVLVFSVGPFSMMGGWGNTRSWQYLYGQSMNPDNIEQRARQDNSDMQRNIGCVLPSVLLGSLTMIIAVIVQTALA